VSIYEDIEARIATDRAADDAAIDQDTLEGARAEIVGEILKIAEHWADKAESWGPEESFTALRDIVCQQILDVLNTELWDDEEGARG
jgi:hypothetical protein